MTKCYLCEGQFEITEEVFQTSVLYGKLNIKRDIDWKDMVMTVVVKNIKDEDVVLCKTCFSGALSRCAQETRKTNIPMTAGIQVMGF